MENYEIGCFVGRLWIEENKGPSIVKVKDNFIFDITSKLVPTMSSLLELENPIDYVKGVEGKKIISIEDIENDINNKNFKTKIRLLAPCDLQAVKACGVTFAKSMVERVIVCLLTETYYKVSIDASFGTGSSDELTYGNFAIHANSKNVGAVGAAQTFIDVDSTIGFPDNGTLTFKYQNGTTGGCTYSSTNITQF